CPRSVANQRPSRLTATSRPSAAVRITVPAPRPGRLARVPWPLLLLSGRFEQVELACGHGRPPRQHSRPLEPGRPSYVVAQRLPPQRQRLVSPRARSSTWQARPKTEGVLETRWLTYAVPG